MRELINTIAGLRPPVFIMGGLAEDMLLGQGLDQLQPHKDLDLLVRRDELERFRAQLAAAGVAEWEVVLGDRSGQPLMLSGHAPLEDNGPTGGLEVEAYIAAPEPDGGYSIEVPPQGPAGRLRLFLPPDTFEFPVTPLNGLSFQTVSPLALALLRAASAQTRHTGEKRARDLAVLAQLRQRYLAGYGDRQLQARIEVV